MQQHTPLSKAATYFASLIGKQHVVTDAQQLQAWNSDWSKVRVTTPGMVVFPQTTAEVAGILRYCNEHGHAVVPSGGRTGLAGGAIADHHEIILSLARMNKILHLDSENMSIETEAGVITEELQRAAHQARLFFPIDLAAKGSCQIGGNIATNAGGLKFIRFGGTREQVLGLEVVLADGTILNLNRSLRKDNSGYDLKQLFIGSEGTLGVITKATLRLTQQPKDVQVLCYAVDDFSKLAQIFTLSQQQGLTLSAFEFFSQSAYDKVKTCHPQVREICTTPAAFYGLLEVEGDSRSLGPMVEEFSQEIFDKGLALDGTIAISTQERRELWFVRESITESLGMLGQVRKNDISLPLSNIAAFCQELSKVEIGKREGYEVVMFGHLGDGNIHLNYFAPKTAAASTFKIAAEQFTQEVLRLIKHYQGSISAEHGIGILKKNELLSTRSATELMLMKQIKNLLDPKGIMNPGKIFM